MLRSFAATLKAPMSYLAFKSLHIASVVIFLGNIVITAVWKVLADRTADPKVVAFVQRLVTVTDFAFTAGGMVLILIGGLNHAPSESQSASRKGPSAWSRRHTSMA